MPSKVLMASVTRLAKRMIKGYTIKFHPVKLSDKDFLNAIGYKTTDEILNRNFPQFFFNPKDKDKIIDTIKKEYPESIEQTINDANKICNHIFDLLGSGKTELGKELDWHSDFKSGFSGIQKSIASGLESILLLMTTPM